MIAGHSIIRSLIAGLTSHENRSASVVLDIVVHSGVRPVTRRIILYCDSPIAGGFELAVARLASTLAARGLAVELWYWHPRLGDLVRDHGLVTRRLASASPTPLPFLKALNPLAVWRLARLFQAAPSDLLVVCQGSIELGATALIAARLLGIPVVSYLAFAFDLRTIGARLGHVREAVDRLYYRLPMSFITWSEFQRELLLKRVDVPVHVLSPAVANVELGTPRSRTGDPQALELGIVGSVAFSTKGQDVGPALLGAIQRRGTKARIHIVGDGPDLDPLRRMVETARLSERFIFHGQVPYGSPLEIMRGLDVLVIPSRFEGTIPHVGFEALAAGIPFVMSNLASIRDWQVPPQLLFDRTSPDDIARAVEEAMRFGASPEFEPYRRRMLASVSVEAFERDAMRALEAIFATIGPAQARRGS